MRLTLAAVTLALALPAGAQRLEPTETHYRLARDAIAIDRATRALLRAEVAAEARRNDLARQRAETQAADREALRRADAHAAKVQAWAGEPRTSLLPGTGYIIIHPRER